MTGVTEYTLKGDMADLGDTKDVRVRRILNGHLFTKGVAKYRERNAPVAETISGSTMVFVRARPLFQHEAERGEWECVSPEQRGVVVHEGAESVKCRQGLVKLLVHHKFPAVERIDDDEQGYSKVQFLVANAAQGRMSTLFMYGMTGSGKTYSTNIIHQAASHDIFAAQGGKVELICYELIGRRCFDLLGQDKPEVHIRVGEDGATHVQGATLLEARGVEELQDLLRVAAGRRETAATGTNATSSRSHAVYHLNFASGGSFKIIDLAGNEGNIETFHHSKEQMAESAEINASLMALKTCLHARATGSQRIPFRESILTRVLRDALIAPEALTACIVCVSPACSHMEHTLNTLKAALALMGDTKKPVVEEDECKQPSVRMGGPAKWDPDMLAGWLAEQPYGSQVELPVTMSGAAIMKFTEVRLVSLCGGDQTAGKELYSGLREAAKVAAKEDLDNRRALKAPKDLDPGSSRDFSRVAPAQPVVAC